MRQDRGNILFLILLAVVLFAALSYAVTNSTRGGGNDASPEKLNLIASQMVQNVHLIEQNMMRAQVVDSIPDWGFNTYPAQSTNSTCTQTSCNIYAYGGRNGGAPYYKVPAELAADPSGGDITPIWYIYRSMGLGTDANDLAITYVGINKGLCNALNTLLQNGVDVTIGDTINANVQYTGTLTAMPASAGIVGDVNATAIGKKGYCFQLSGGSYRFHYIVMER